MNDNSTESKRVELFRLPQADKQAKVRFRFAHAGTDSWYFGIDDFGIYAIPSAPAEAPKLAWARAGNTVALSWTAGLAGFVLESADALTGAPWTPVAGAANNGATVPLNVGQKFYRLRKP